MFWFCGHETCGILVLQPGIEPTAPALEGKILTTGLLGKSLFFFFLNDYNYRRVRKKAEVNATKTQFRTSQPGLNFLLALMLQQQQQFLLDLGLVKKIKIENMQKVINLFVAQKVFNHILKFSHLCWNVLSLQMRFFFGERKAIWEQNFYFENFLCLFSNDSIYGLFNTCLYVHSVPSQLS